MTCAQTCHGEQSPTEKAACLTTCSRVERMVHNFLRPDAASLDIVAAQAQMLAALGSRTFPRL